MSSRIVLVTGANSGVGYATASVIAGASEDFHVIMTGRSLAKVEKAKSELETAGIKGTLSTMQLDITDDVSIANAVKEVEEKHGKLDVLFNNAAIANADPDLRTRLESCLLTNVVGVALVAKAFRPLLLKSQNAYGIYVTSGAGSLTMAANPTLRHDNEEGYRTSKAAVNMLAVLEARDLRPQGLKVFAMCPGIVRSNLMPVNADPESDIGDPKTSGRLALSIINGERDADVGRVVRTEGRVWDW